jgi:hypothetical protein
MKWWQIIDEHRDGPGVWWREVLGAHHALVQPFLTPSNNLSPAVPCAQSDATGCAYEIRKTPKGEMIGVCETGLCERRNFSRSELAVHTVNGAAIASALAAALNLDHQVENVADAPWSWLAGFDFPTMGFRFPVILVLPDAQDSPEDIIAQLVTRHEKPIFALPTKRGITTAVERMLADRGCGLLVLDGAVGLSPDGKLATGEVVNHVITEFRLKHVPEAFGPALPTFFPTPPKAGWGDLTIKFSTGHDARFSFPGGPSRILSFAQLGMIDERSSNKPTKAWEVLRVFAERDGTLIPKNQTEQKAIEKQKETLSKNLRAFFRIKDEPIPWDYSVNGWVCRFKKIMPVGAET